MPLNGNSFVVVIAFLGFALLMCIGGIIALAVVGNSVPAPLEIASGALTTGLLGMLIRTPEQK